MWRIIKQWKEIDQSWRYTGWTMKVTSEQSVTLESAKGSERLSHGKSILGQESSVQRSWGRTVWCASEEEQRGSCCPRRSRAEREGMRSFRPRHRLWVLLWSTQNARLPRWLSGKKSACLCRRHKRLQFDPWVGKIPWRRAWQPTPVFLPGESYGQRCLEAYSP